MGRYLERATKRQIDAQAPHDCVMPFLELCYSVVAKAGRAAPNGDVAVLEDEFLYRVVALQAAELEGRRQAKRYRYNGIGEITLVLVLVQRKASARFIPINQTRIGVELGIPGVGRRLKRGRPGRG